MRTTIEINDALAARAKILMAKRGTTMRALVEEGIRRVVEADATEAETFALRDASAGAGGLREGVDDLGWDTMSRFLYPDS